MAVTQKSVLASVPTQLYIGGEWRDASSSTTFPVEDPATGRTLVEVADGSVADGKAALDAATSTMPAVAAMTPAVPASFPMTPATPPASPPITVNLQVDGTTLATAVHRADRDTATRSFSPVPAY